MAATMINNHDDEQSQGWETLYSEIQNFLKNFGREDFAGKADFWIDDDNIGTNQQKIFFNDLKLLDPAIVYSLQKILITTFPDWEIVVAVALRGAGEKWPEMGLIIRAHEIIDGLQRQYFPPEFQSFRYEGSRPGTDRD